MYRWVKQEREREREGGGRARSGGETLLSGWKPDCLSPREQCSQYSVNCASLLRLEIVRWNSPKGVRRRDTRFQLEKLKRHPGCREFPPEGDMSSEPSTEMRTRNMFISYPHEDQALSFKRYWYKRFRFSRLRGNFGTLNLRDQSTLSTSKNRFFTFPSHTEYVKKESIVIAWVKKKTNSLLLMNVHVLYVLEDKRSKKNSVCLSVWLAGCTWTFAVDTITFEGVSGSKQNLVGVFYVWNVGLILKSKVTSWSWSWTEFWFSQKLCGATLNSVGIFSI